MKKYLVILFFLIFVSMQLQSTYYVDDDAIDDSDIGAIEYRSQRLAGVLYKIGN